VHGELLPSVPLPDAAVVIAMIIVAPNPKTGHT